MGDVVKADFGGLQRIAQNFTDELERQILDAGRIAGDDDELMRRKVQELRALIEDLKIPQTGIELRMPASAEPEAVGEAICDAYRTAYISFLNALAPRLVALCTSLLTKR